MDDQPSADYPLGGSVEPYDIEVEKEIMSEVCMVVGHTKVLDEKTDKVRCEDCGHLF